MTGMAAATLSACGGGPATGPANDVGSATTTPTGNGAPVSLDAADLRAAWNGSPSRLDVQVLDVIPHDPGAFTQGLEFDDSGTVVFESTGQYGESTVRRVDPVTGEVQRNKDLDPSWFGEGLTRITVDGRDEIAVLTWREGVASFRDPETLDEVRQARYEGEGWGLCAPGDGTLIMSDGSDRLTVRDPSTFAALGSVAVTSGGSPLGNLNELECHDGLVWANVWQTDLIVAIDPATGVVLADADLAALRSRNTGGDVTNGIAHRPGSPDEFIVGGKWWSEHYLVRLVPTGR